MNLQNLDLKTLYCSNLYIILVKIDIRVCLNAFIFQVYSSMFKCIYT